MERLSIVNYSNAFFGAFFGFWCKSMLDPLIAISAGDWACVTGVTAIILLAVSLHVAGLWKSRDIFYTTQVGTAFSSYKFNWISIGIFVSAMFGLSYWYKQALLFPSAFGILLYIWWVVGTFVALILTQPETEGTS